MSAWLWQAVTRTQRRRFWLFIVPVIVFLAGATAYTMIGLAQTYQSLQAMSD